jgi:hypothetical protein
MLAREVEDLQRLGIVVLAGIEAGSDIEAIKMERGAQSGRQVEQVASAQYRIGGPQVRFGEWSMLLCDGCM